MSTLDVNFPSLSLAQRSSESEVAYFCGIILIGARLIIKLRQVSYSLSSYLFFWKSLTRRMFPTTDESSLYSTKSVILGAIIHGHAFMPAPKLSQVTMRKAWDLFYAEVKRWLWTIFALIVAVTKGVVFTLVSDTMSRH